MKKFTHFLFLLPLIWLCTACPYNSKVPIDEAKIKINDAIIGSWEKSVNSKDYVEVKKLNEFTYLVEQFTAHETNRTFERKEYHAHISVVNNQQFLNVKRVPLANSPSSSENGFFLYKIEMPKTDEVRLTPLTEFIREQFTDSQSLRKFIEKHMNLSFFYEKEDVFKRKL
jgi:hypothetical protein